MSMTLSATGVVVVVSTAEYTVAIPPRPRYAVTL